MKVIAAVFVASVIFTGHVFTKEHFWREYTGRAPDDAFVAGEEGLVPFYIGKVYVHGVGVLAGQLFGGTRDILVTGGVEYYGYVFERQEDIKILCIENPDRLEWVKTNRSFYHLLDRDLVAGGQQFDREGALSIGRIDFDGLKIGKVDGYSTSVVDIYWVYDDKEYSTAYLRDDFDYEVLAYKIGPE